MPRPPSEIRTNILSVTIRQLRTLGAGSLTIDGIAREAACAKGLVSYHYRTKAALVTAAAEALLRQRENQWEQALRVASPESAITATWQLIAIEASSGFWRAWTSLAASGKLTGGTVNNVHERFSSLLSSSVCALLKRMGLVPTITRDELGHLLAAAVQGLGLQLAGGANAKHLEGAHAALWAAVLGLTRPGPGA